MVPVHTATAFQSPFVADAPDEKGFANIYKEGRFFSKFNFQKKLNFLICPPLRVFHTGILHNCTQRCFSHNRFTDLHTIQIKAQNMQVLCNWPKPAAGRTIAEKTLSQLAEVVRAAYL